MDKLIDTNELAELRTRYGEPVVWQRTQSVTPKLLVRRKRALETKRGETVLVIPRPGDRVLLHTKAFYPRDAFRLLSGGIERGESVLTAAAREVSEETGFDVKPMRFLGVVDYELVNGADCIPWVSYIFQTGETGADPRPADLDEQISEFREIRWNELPQVADNLERLEADWNDWGRFRAVPHRLVWEAIQRGSR